MTSDTLVESVERRISFPLSQNTLTYNDVLAMASEELMLNAVPQIMQERAEYFVFKVVVPLVNNVGRYEIPYRTMGMALRDVAFSDASGNFFKMSRVAPEDRAFWQVNLGSNQTIGKYYIEGNEIVLTPDVMTSPTGSLNFFIYLRPNQLVKNDRAAVIQHFDKDITITNNANISAGDTIIITTGLQTPSPVISILTAVSSSPGVNEFEIGVNAATTAQNITNAIVALGLDDILSVSNGASVATVSYENINVSFVVLSSGLSVDSDNIYIRFDNLASTYTDSVTDLTTPLYTVGGKVDFLQTNPGHRTYAIDVKLRAIPSSNVGRFKAEDLKVYSSNSSGGIKQFVSLKIGDYICLANECIIPQIPSELHTALAERTASRVLMAIGDREGLAVSQQKIAEMDQKQATMIGSRVEGAPPKVFNSRSLLRLGKRTGRRRV